MWLGHNCWRVDVNVHCTCLLVSDRYANSWNYQCQMSKKWDTRWPIPISDATEPASTLAAVLCVIIRVFVITLQPELSVVIWDVNTREIWIPGAELNLPGPIRVVPTSSCYFSRSMAKHGVRVCMVGGCVMSSSRRHDNNETGSVGRAWLTFLTNLVLAYPVLLWNKDRHAEVVATMQSWESWCCSDIYPSGKPRIRVRAKVSVTVRNLEYLVRNAAVLRPLLYITAHCSSSSSSSCCYCHFRTAT